MMHTSSRCTLLATRSILLVSLLVGCETSDPVAETDSVPVTAQQTIDEIVRDDELFTQGLQFSDDGQSLYHSGGGYSDSSVVRFSRDGEELARYEPGEEFFLEGLTLVGDELYVLTWKEHRVIVLDAETLLFKRTLDLPGQGWGIAWDETRELLWISDGSSTIRAFDESMGPRPDQDFTVRLPGGSELDQINELELIDGMLWANVWKTDAVISMRPGVGAVETMLDLSDLVPEGAGRGKVTNGIARDPLTDQVWITGKYWDRYWILDEELFRAG